MMAMTTSNSISVNASLPVRALDADFDIGTNDFYHQYHRSFSFDAQAGISCGINCGSARLAPEAPQARDALALTKYAMPQIR